MGSWQKTWAQQQNAPSSLITLRRNDDFTFQSVPKWVERSEHPYVVLFPAVLPQMRARVPQVDPQSQSSGIMNSLRPVAPHMLNLWLQNHMLANLLPCRCSALRLPTPTSNLWGQGLGRRLPLQTTFLSATNNWDAYYKNCRFANCMNFHVLSQNH